MARDQLVDLNFVGGTRPTNIPNPVSSGDAANKSYVDAAIEGISWKDAVRAASTANLTLSGPGATIDGVTMATSDRVLLKNQTTGSQNGIYVWTGAATPMTRAADASTFAELEGAVVIVEEGTANIGTSWRQTAINGTIDTDPVAFTAFLTGAAAASESAAGIAEIATQTEVDSGNDDQRFVTSLKLKASKHFTKPFSQDLGDNSATSFNIDHNFNTRDVIVTVRKNSGNYDDVIADVTRPSVNRVTVTFAVAPTAAQYRATVIGQQN